MFLTIEIFGQIPSFYLSYMIFESYIFPVFVLITRPLRSLTIRILNLEYQGSIYLFLIINLSFKSIFYCVFFKTFFAIPIPVHCMSYRILSLLSPLDVLFSDNFHIGFCGHSLRALPLNWARHGS